MHVKIIVLGLIFLAIISKAAGEPRKKPPLEKASVGQVKQLDKPTTKPAVKPARKPFPPHWGKPPSLQTRDMRPLPFGFGMGSSSLAGWIKENVKKDKENKAKPDRPKRPEPSPEVKAMAQELREKRKVLDSAKKELHENLKGKSREAVVELIKAFRDSHKEKHQEHKEAHKKLL